ncbi:MAG: serine/threonine protein kinase [Myxococcota bacterium]
MSLTTPTELGPYQATRLLSAGAQASIWLADGPHGEVAMKVARGDEHVESLAREIKILRDGPSHGLVRLVDSDPNGRWMAMERVRGLLIDQWAQTRTDQEIVEAIDKLLAVLQALHETGVVHGDIKPGNVMVDHDGQPRVLDLGIAVMPGEEVEHFRGTLGYAAPEVLQGKTPTPRSDLYGVGAVLYRCLAQRDVFEAPDPAALAYLPMVGLPVPPSTWRPGLSRRLEHVCLTLLSRDPVRRPATAERARGALEKALEGEPARWVLGMLQERATLARAAVGAADGESRVVCVYGPPGSGRRTLIAEATDAARRLGLQSVRLADLSKNLTGTQPVVLVARARQRRALEVARAFLKGKLPGLVLLHSERPVPSLGDEAIQLTPPPLGPTDVARLARHMRVDPELAEKTWAQWAGHPSAVLGRLRASLDSFDPTDVSYLSSEAKQILAHLSSEGEVDVVALAGHFRIDPHTLLDHCAALLAEGRLVSTRQGASLAPVTLA